MRPLLIAVIVAVVLGVSCKDPEDALGVQLAASFAADEPAPGNQTVAMAESSSTGNTLLVEINLTGIDDFFGSSFAVEYDSASVVFVSATAGAVLGASPSLLVTDDGSGTVQVGATRTGGTVTDVAATQALVTLTFRAIAAGTSDIDFASAELYTAGPAAIAGISWFGGTVVATD